MTLQEQLDAKRIESEARREQGQIDIMKNQTERLIREGVGKSALGVGEQIPAFKLPNVHGNSIESSDLLKNGPIILTFYRGSWCPYCNLELRAYQQQLTEIKTRGAQLVAISPELPDASLSALEKLELEFEVLSDVGNVIAKKFGLVFQMSPDLTELYQQFNIDIPKRNGDESWELPIPATYVIAPDGKIIFSHVDPDYLKRADPQEAIAALSGG